MLRKLSQPRWQWLLWSPQADLVNNPCALIPQQIIIYEPHGHCPKGEMTTGRRGRPHSCVVKKWDPLFLTNRVLTDTETRGELGKRLNTDLSELRFFLQESDGPVPSSLVDDIEEFCEGFRSEDLETTSAAQSKTIWLDERSAINPAKECRPHPQLLTATEFCECLEVPVRY
jgi:hypothetical protein